MFTGLGVWIGSEVFGWGRNDAEAGMIAAFVGFGLVSLPLALRELDRKRATN